MPRASPLPLAHFLVLGLVSSLTACQQSSEPERHLRQRTPTTSPSNTQVQETFKHVAQGIQMASSQSDSFDVIREELVSDETITAHVQHDLRNDSELSRFQIDIDTLDGVVTLSGNLPNTASKTRAETLAKLNHGVKFVNNLLQVLSPPSPTTFGLRGPSQTAQGH